MPRRIQIRRGVTPGVYPTALLEGELAINVADRRLFVGDAEGNAVQVFDGAMQIDAVSVAITQAAAAAEAAQAAATAAMAAATNGSGSIQDAISAANTATAAANTAAALIGASLSSITAAATASANAAVATAAAGAISGAIATEVTNRNTAIFNEAQLRISADQTEATTRLQQINLKQDLLTYRPTRAEPAHDIAFNWNGQYLFPIIDGYNLGGMWTDIRGSANFSGSGYALLPNGLMVQWGGGITTYGNQDGFNFYTSFPTNCLSVVPISLGAASWVASDNGLMYPRVPGVFAKFPSYFSLTTILLLPQGGHQFAPGEIISYIAVGN